MLLPTSVRQKQADKTFLFDLCLWYLKPEDSQTSLGILKFWLGRKDPSSSELLYAQNST